jgi:hypothetical protein
MQVSVTPVVPTVSPFLARLPTLTAGIQATPEPPQNASQTFPSLVGARALAADRPLSEQRPVAERSGVDNTGGEAPRLPGSAGEAPIAAIAGRDSGGPGDGSDGGREQDGRTGTEGETRAAEEDPTAPRGADGDPLSREEVAQLRELKARDREVRQHEQAHQTVGGRYAGSASFTYQRGPDGNAYAVGGEVPIDVSPVPGDPQGTISKMRIVRAAALAPAEPSAADQQVAARANRTIVQAQSELMRERQEERTGSTEDSRAASGGRGMAADNPAGAAERAGGGTDPGRAGDSARSSAMAGASSIAAPEIMIARNAEASRAYASISESQSTLAPAALFERVA